MEEFGLMSSTLSDNFSKLKDMIQNAKKEVWYITEMFEEGHGDLNGAQRKYCRLARQARILPGIAAPPMR